MSCAGNVDCHLARYGRAPVRRADCIALRQELGRVAGIHLFPANHLHDRDAWGRFCRGACGAPGHIKRSKRPRSRTHFSEASGTDGFSNRRSRLRSRSCEPLTRCSTRLLEDPGRSAPVLERPAGMLAAFRREGCWCSGLLVPTRRELLISVTLESRSSPNRLAFPGSSGRTTLDQRELSYTLHCARLPCPAR